MKNTIRGKRRNRYKHKRVRRLRSINSYEMIPANSEKSPTVILLGMPADPDEMLAQFADVSAYQLTPEEWAEQYAERWGKTDASDA